MDGTQTSLGRHELASVLDLAPDAIMLRDMDGRITLWNRACHRLYGWSADEAVGQLAHDLLGTRYPLAPELIEAALDTDGQWQGEVTRTARGGAGLTIAIHWALRRDTQGAAIEILETARDATEDHRAQEALAYAEYRYRNMFRAMAVSFWELDFTGVGAMMRGLRKQGITDMRAHIAANPGFLRQAMLETRVIDVNEKTIQLFGGTCREDLMISVEPFWPRASEDVYAGSLIAAVEGKPHFEAETRLRTLQGREIDALFTTCYPRDENGKGGAVVLVGVVDISERVRARDELARTQADLAHAARVSTLGELSASIAHEVNQPLAAVVTNADAALRWLGRAEPDLGEARAAIGRIVNEGKRASDIIARIRTLSTKSAPAPTDLDCAALIREAAQLVAREIQNQDVALTLAIAPSLPSIRADRVQVQQVVINLMVNAIQAMAQTPRGQRNLAIRADCADGSILIEVEDSGPGIAPEHAGRLFNAFFTTKASGMGMGLSICKSIAEAHGGRIWAARAPSGGAVFSLKLPVLAA